MIAGAAGGEEEIKSHGAEEEGCATMTTALEVVPYYVH